ncbi:kinase-like domain-containing protein [Lasiosphaeria ovina]|uniref:Kinase-like domain-containing protein n=1 Tax=Lasiosphaeria ovina TaxID=92902 RepID=A0AAE0JV41_9PEZI|nr:kinase-like domain-containing protein [Lasiosphaeria ovina]
MIAELKQHVKKMRELELVGAESETIEEGEAPNLPFVNVIQVGDENYTIGKKIGEGAFGAVFGAECLLTGMPVAMKFDEFQLYKNLQSPRVFYFGEIALHKILIMDLLGRSLQDLFIECNRKFSQKTRADLYILMLRTVEDVHAKGYIDGDLKPGNFLFGRPGTPTADALYAVDFSMARAYKDSKTKQHIPHKVPIIKSQQGSPHFHERQQAPWRQPIAARRPREFRLGVPILPKW